MFSLEYLRRTSLLNGKEKLMGNLEAAGLIENMAFECIKNDIGLYAAQEQIKAMRKNIMWCSFLTNILMSIIHD